MKELEEEKAKSIQNAPSGKIHRIKCREYVQYYLRTDVTDKSGKYIPKKDHQTIKKYVQKSYDEKVYKLIEKELNSLQKFINSADMLDEKIKNEFSGQPEEVKEYITPIDMSDDDYIKEWLNISYEPKPVVGIETIYETDKGEIVRSKSELTIANMLFKCGIPYKYECPIKLKNGITIYPDFTLLDVRRRKEIYWEHRGMMDDCDYANHAVKRIKDLSQIGIVIGDNLIITEETRKSPLGTNEIENIINNIIGI